MTEQLVYQNIWDSVFPNDPEKAKDYETLSKLVIKYDTEVQAFYGTREQLKEIKNDSLFLSFLRAQGLEEWEGYQKAVEMLTEATASAFVGCMGDDID